MVKSISTTFSCLVVFACLAHPVLASDLVHLAFEATITSLPSSEPFVDGVDSSIGDKIRGTLTFHADAGNGGDLLLVTQNEATATFRFGDILLRSQGYEIEVSNDLEADVDCNDLFCPMVFDSVQFKGLGYDEASSGIPAAVNLDSSGFLLQIRWNNDPNFAGVGVWDTAIIPDNPAVWQTEPLSASLQISLTGTPVGSRTIFAEVTRIAVVPEPSTAVVLVIASVGLLRRSVRLPIN